jgi:hypothetical protein
MLFHVLFENAISKLLVKTAWEQGEGIMNYEVGRRETF